MKPSTRLPGDIPLCGEDVADVMFIYEPAAVARYVSCLALAAEDLADNNEYQGHRLHCRQKISAQGGVEWCRAVRQPCPRAAGPGGRVGSLHHTRERSWRRIPHLHRNHQPRYPPYSLQWRTYRPQMSVSCGTPRRSSGSEGQPALTFKAMNGTVRANLITENQYDDMSLAT